LSDWRFESPNFLEGLESPSFVPEEVQFLRNAVKQGFPVPKEWEKLLQGIKQELIVDQLLIINSLINDTHFLPHQPGGWKYPREFLRTGGDCEGFAIAKYVLLRQLNFTDDKLRIAAVKSTRGAKEYHMVVIVKKGEKPTDLIMLDIEHDYPRSIIYADDFRIFISFNENKLWRHGISRSGYDPRQKWGGCVTK